MERLWPPSAPDGRPAASDVASDAARGGTGPGDLHADLARRTTWVASNFVMALDGAIAVDGRSGALGGDGDLAVFRSLRDHADVILVGAGTVRAESYGPTRVRSVEARRARGQEDRPRLVVVTRSADLADTERLWSDAAAPISVLTGTDAPSDRVAWLRERSEVISIGDHGPDLAAGLAHLRDRGMGRILTEGGPSLQVGLLTRGLVTDLFTTIAPLVVGGGRTTTPQPLPRPLDLALVATWRHDDEVFLHHRVSGR